MFIDMRHDVLFNLLATSRDLRLQITIHHRLIVVFPYQLVRAYSLIRSGLGASFFCFFAEPDFACESSGAALCPLIV